MRVVHYPARDRNRDAVLLIALPGVGIEPEDFVEHGFVESVQRGRPIVHVTAAAADLSLYLDRTVVEDIHRQIVVPLRAEGLRRLWFLGVSLGGMGALLYARAHPEAVEGVILLAPFIGTPGIVAEVIRAGGFAEWEPGKIAANDMERMLLASLKDYLSAALDRPKLYLGFGRHDRFAAGHVLLADHLPARRVFSIDGGHDWTTWRGLLQRILEADPFTIAIKRSTL